MIEADVFNPHPSQKRSTVRVSPRKCEDSLKKLLDGTNLIEVEGAIVFPVGYR